MFHKSFTTVFAIALATSVFAQGAGISLSPSNHDTKLPVEVTADNLTVEQSSNTAVFKGNARVAQGDLRFGANSITVSYDSAGSTVSTITAVGDVLFTNGNETAEGQRATYTVATGQLILSGDVLLLQGPNAISGDRMRLDLNTNKAVVEGNVKTVLAPR